MKKGIYILFILSILLNIVFVVYGTLRYISNRGYNPDNISYDGNRHKMYQVLPVNRDDNVFIGDSHIYKYNLHEFFKNPNLKNRGIDGDTSPGLYYRFDDILKYNPKTIFIKIGVNDIKTNIPADSSGKYLNKIIDKIKSNTSVQNFYFISMFPATAVDNHKIIAYNSMLKDICIKKDVDFINAYPHFLVNGKLNEKLISDDGLHLSGEGYYLLSSILKPYIK
jgi:lysophospholipase L1-like esterase